MISEPVLLEQYVALADFKKIGRGQIGLVAGDVVDVIEKSDNGMLCAMLHLKKCGVQVRKTRELCFKYIHNYKPVHIALC